MSQVPVKKLDDLTGSNVFLVYSTNLNDPEGITYSNLLSAFRRDFTSPTLVQDIQTPTTGATLKVETGNSTWLIIRPAGAIAALAITLPTALQAVDGQDLVVVNTNQISALTFNVDASHSLIGAPSVLAAEDGFTLRFNLETLTWYIKK